VHGLRAPFTCVGTLVPDQAVTLRFPDNTQIAVLRAKDTFEQERLLRPLVERCTAAAFGMAQAVDPDLPALSHLHTCEYSATGYFGNEGGEIDLYIYCALHVAIPPYGEGSRAVTGTKLSIVSPSTRRESKRRG